MSDSSSTPAPPHPPATDPPFQVQFAARVQRLPPYMFGRINNLLYEKRRAGHDVIDMGMGNPSEPPDPQVIENNYIIDFDHPSLGPVKLTGFPVNFSKTPPSMKKAAPLYGQHTEEILQEMLGLSWDELASLKEEGVIN